MKWLFTARSFGILLIVLALGVLGWATVKDTRPYQQAAYTLQNVSQSVSLIPSKSPSTYLQNLGETEHLQFSRDGSRLFVRTDQGHITVYEVGSWKKLRQWKTDNGQIFASPDGKRLFVAVPARDRLGYRFSLWEVDSGKRLASWADLSEHALYSRDSPGYNTFGTISPDLSQVVLCSYEKNPDSKSKITHLLNGLWVVDASTGKKLRQIPIKSRGGVSTIVRWEKQTLWVEPYYAGALRFRLSDWQLIPSLPDITFSRFSADGNLLVGADNPDHSVFTRNPTAPLQPPAVVVLYNQQTKTTQRIRTDLDNIRAVCPAKEALIIHGFKKNVFAPRNPFREVLQIRTHDGKQVKAEIIANLVKMDAQWKLAAVRRNQNYIDIYQTATGKRLCRLDLTANPLNGRWETLDTHNWERIKFSPDGKWCVVSNQSGLIRIWELPHD